jgi:hypothetical protein
MKTANLANEALRQADVGHVWEERITSGSGTLTLSTSQTFRVRAAAAVTVTIDGTLAATMISGEILIFNTGSGQPTSVDQTVKQASQSSVIITGTAFVQVARDNTRKV